MMAQNNLLPCRDYDYEEAKFIIDLTPENNKVTKNLLEYIVSHNLDALFLRFFCPPTLLSPPIFLSPSKVRGRYGDTYFVHRKMI